MRLALLTGLVLCAFATACGDDDGDDGGGGNGNCTGRNLQEDNLCDLNCNQSTMADTQSELGQPTTSNSTVLQYVYNCVEGSSASSKIYMFYYDNGVLVDVSLTASGEFAGQTVPSCIASCTIRN